MVIGDFAGSGTAWGLSALLTGRERDGQPAPPLYESHAERTLSILDVLHCIAIIIMRSVYRVLHPLPAPVPLPSLQSRSFSLLYSDRSLDIVCKDRREFEVWTTGLQVSVTTPTQSSHHSNPDLMATPIECGLILPLTWPSNLD